MGDTTPYIENCCILSSLFVVVEKILPINQSVIAILSHAIHLSGFVEMKACDLVARNARVRVSHVIGFVDTRNEEKPLLLSF